MNPLEAIDRLVRANDSAGDCKCGHPAEDHAVMVYDYALGSCYNGVVFADDDDEICHDDWTNKCKCLEYNPS